MSTPAAEVIKILPEFRAGSDDWNVYRELLEEFFLANEIGISARVSVLLRVIGKETYSMLRDLCHPQNPKSMTYDGLCRVLEDRFVPVVAVFRQRSQFYRAEQRRGESVKDWYARLKVLSVKCEFTVPQLEALILDRFIIGLAAGPAQDRLCEENPTTLKIEQAVRIAALKEAAQAKDQEHHLEDAVVEELAGLTIGRQEGPHGRHRHGKYAHHHGHAHGHRHRHEHDHHRHHGPPQHRLGERPGHGHHDHHDHHHHEMRHQHHFGAPAGPWGGHGGEMPSRHFGPAPFGPGPWGGRGHRFGTAGGTDCPGIAERFGWRHKRLGSHERSCRKWRKHCRRRCSSTSSSSSSSSSGSSGFSATSVTDSPSDTEKRGKKCHKMRKCVGRKQYGKRHDKYGKRHAHDGHHGHGGRRGCRGQRRQKDEGPTADEKLAEQEATVTEPTTEPELIDRDI